MTNRTTKMPRQTGFTLIEVMVTVIVLAIGLLGLAGLQATSLRFNSSAYLRSQATNLAYDMADRMRVNRQAALNGGYNIAITAATPTGTTLADIDRAEWRTALANTLPMGRGGITLNGNIFTISIQWDDDRDGVLNPPFDMDTEL